MKYRISVSLDEEVVLKMKEAIRTKSEFENQSHFVETAIKNILNNK